MGRYRGITDFILRGKKNAIHFGVFFASVFFISSMCSRPPVENKVVEDVAIVISGSNDVRVGRDGQEMAVLAGMRLRSEDIIKTSQGMVDIQTRGGGLIRLRQFTTVQIASLLQDDSGNTKTEFDLKSGVVFARAQKRNAKDEFLVVTPTSIASVRGTAFSVELAETGDAMVKVYEGKVAVRPSIPTIRNMEEKDLSQKAELIQIEKSFESQEEIVGEGESCSFGDANARLITDLDQRLKSNNEPVDVASLETHLGESRIVRKIETGETSAKDKVELETMVRVDDATFAEAVKASDDRESEMQKSIREERKEKIDRVLQDLQKSSEKKGPRSEADLKNEYDMIEIVRSRDGSLIRGAIMTQLEDALVVDTTEGVVKIPLSQVDSIEIH